MLIGLNLYGDFLTSGRSKRFTIQPNIHPFMHAFTHEFQPRRATAGWSGVVRVRRRLAQGHLLHTPLGGGGAGDRTSNLLVTSQPALPPEPHAQDVTENTLGIGQLYRS